MPSSGNTINQKALTSFLKSEGLIKDSTSPLNIVPFTNGYSNLTYKITVDHRDFVLRKPPVGAIKRGHDMGREFTVQKALQNHYSVPKMYAYSNEEAIVGSPFYLMEYVAGIILNHKEAKKRAIPPQAYQTIASTWLSSLIDLHSIDYTAVGLADLGKPEGYVARQVTNWSRQFIQAKTKEIPVADHVMKWISVHQPTQYDHCLIHNDYKYDNVVFRDTSWQEIAAVLDWEMATLGDPLMDLGTSLGYWTMASDHEFVKQGIPTPTVFEGNPSRTEIAHLYATQSGRTLDHLVFYYAFGLFKIAVIAQQIYYRYAKGLTSDPKFSQLNKAAALCCTLAWQAIQTKKIDG